MIPEEKVREVRERAGILDIVSDYVGLRKSGANYLGLCPFHAEKTPSFNVNPSKGIFHCFGCGVGGDAVSFIMRMEGLSFPDAVKFLAARVGITITERPLTSHEKQLANERDTLTDLNELAVRFYEKILLEDKRGEAGRQYLQRRGVSQDVARVYRLGYAPDAWDTLARYLERKNIPLEMAEKLGLVRRRERGGFYDNFRNRLLFPISDMHGRPIGFGGRVMDGTLPKYLNTPESPVYRKSEILFGINMAKQAMREKGEVFIVEGYFDHLALYRAGISNVVATCGTALTVSHAKLLRRFAGKVHLLFDGDSAGRKATLRAMDIFLGEDIPACVVQMPDGEDPDTYLEKNGPESFSRLVSSARPVFEFFFKDLCKRSDISSVEGIVAVIDELSPRLCKIPDSVERDLHIREIARVLAIEEKDIRRKMGKGAFSPRSLSADRERRTSAFGPEEMLLSLMVKYPEIVRLVVDFGPENIFGREVMGVAKGIIAQSGASARIDLSSILDEVDSHEERSRLASLFISEDHLEGIDVKKAFEQCRRTLDRIALHEIKELSIQLSRTEPESENYHELLKRIDCLRAKKSLLR